MTKKVNGGVYFISLQVSLRNSNETCCQGRMSPLLIVTMSVFSTQSVTAVLQTRFAGSAIGQAV